MNIRKFIAESPGEALKLVKKEMGEDAVIIRTKTLSDSGRAGKYAKRVEVTAAIDYDVPEIRQTKESDEDIKELARELKEIKNVLLFNEAGKVLEPDLYYNREIREKYNYMKTFGLNENVISRLMTERMSEHDDRPVKNSRLLQDSLMDVLTKIKINNENCAPKGRKIYSFIGPTGVGKTTTLAKLAAESALQQGYKTALITLDTFRIAAAAQLEAYTRIMGLPMEVAVSGSDLNRAIKKYDDYDRIFIDTAGRSPNSDQGNNDLIKLFKNHENVHGYLVISATTQYKNMLNTSDRFESLPYHSYIFSKLDETEDLSPMINFLISKDKPVSYFTTGQQVPEDIEAASKKKMASFLLSGIKEKPNTGLNEGIYNGSSCRS